jgi:hypothetical protein
MTKSVTRQHEGNGGDHEYVIAEVDISSLDSAGTEPFDPDSLFGIRNADVSVLDQEERRRRFQYDQDNTQLRVTDRGPVINQRSVDPGNQTYSSGTETTIATYDAGPGGALEPTNFNPADPSDAGLSIILRAEFHDGTTTDLVSIADGTEQTRENLIDGFGTGDDGLSPRKLLVIVDETTGSDDATEDIGASTTEFTSYNANAANNDDVGTVTVRVEGNRSA